jgi:hypothetical protein
MARSYRYLLRIEQDAKGRPVEKAKADRKLRELVAERFRISQKTLDRWLHVLDLPRAIQEAVEGDRLPLTLAVRVASLAPAAQEEIAARVRQGEAPRSVIMPFLTKGKKDPDTVGKALAQLVASLQSAQQVLGNRIDEVKGCVFGEHLEILRDGQKLLAALVAQVERRQARTLSKIERIAALMGRRDTPATAGTEGAMASRDDEEE